MKDPSNNTGERRPEWHAGLQYANLGFQFVCAILLGYWGGGWAGRKWSLAWAETAGLVAGFVVGLWMLVRASMDWERSQKKKP